MFQLPRRWGACLCLAACVFATPFGRTNSASADVVAPADNEATGSTFLRYVEDKNGGATLQAAIVSYTDAQGRQVDLISAVHVGEKAYYAALSKQFPAYDALLYELVKPKGAGVPQPGMKAAGAVSGFQRMIKTALSLEFQLDAIDYTAKNFVHADLDAETFTALQESRGESLFSLMFQSMMSQMARQAAGTAKPVTMVEILMAMNSSDSARQYKLLLGRQFEDMEAQIAGLGGKEGTVILDERNKAALKVLKSSLQGGKKHIGLFYGAAHMKGIEKTMLADMGFKKTGEQWLTAWDMTAVAKPVTQPATLPATLPAK